jgi:hypothetical protein
MWQFAAANLSIEDEMPSQFQVPPARRNGRGTPLMMELASRWPYPHPFVHMLLNCAHRHPEELHLDEASTKSIVNENSSSVRASADRLPHGADRNTALEQIARSDSTSSTSAKSEAWGELIAKVIMLLRSYDDLAAMPLAQV